MAISEQIPDYILAPIKRITAPNTPVPFTPALEQLHVPQENRIGSEVKEMFEL